MHQSPEQILRGARELLSDPKKWTKGKLAKNELGLEVNTQDEAAVCYCAMGAIDKLAGNDVVRHSAALSWLIAALPSGNVVLFNDAPETTHADILDLFDKAIELCTES